MSDTMKARARRTDPATSHEAAQLVEITGKAGSQRRLCYDEVFRNPGSTASEIAAALQIERIIPGKRLPELRDGGVIKTGSERICRVRGTMCMTWWPAAAPEMKQATLPL